VEEDSNIVNAATEIAKNYMLKYQKIIKTLTSTNDLP